tara:strand:+ start:206 stop:412 length:207 start_codon:yes stop_codon:yes gene_type:complete
MKTIDLNRFHIIHNDVFPIRNDEIIAELKTERIITIIFGVATIGLAIAAIILNENNKNKNNEKEVQFS